MTAQTFTFPFLGQTLHLSPLHALYWEEREVLLASDLHLGKISHFRKSGIALPGYLHESDLQKLDRLIVQFSPKEVLFLGDLFHSSHNIEWDIFTDWMNGHKGIRFTLVMGNHDVLHPSFYENSFLHLCPELSMFPFFFTHIPSETCSHQHYNIAGHVHPSIVLVGKGRQKVTLPCFYFGSKNCIMPSFGRFTGNHPIRPGLNDHVFLITPEKVIPYR